MNFAAASQPMAFELPDDPLVFSSRKVMFEDWPAPLVSHDEDGAWQFVNGWGDCQGRSAKQWTPSAPVESLPLSVNGHRA